MPSLKTARPTPARRSQPESLICDFRYNSRIDQGRSRLTLIRPDNTKTTVAISPGTPPDIIGARLDLPPGTYVVRWQVLAIDGHITRGDVPFTVMEP